MEESEGDVFYSNDSFIRDDDEESEDEEESDEISDEIEISDESEDEPEEVVLGKKIKKEPKEKDYTKVFFFIFIYL